MKRIVAILLLLTLSLSMWGCSSSPTSTTKPNQQSNRPNSSVSNQRPNNNNSSSNNSSTKIDPNGFSSLEQLVKAYVDMQTCSITKEQYRKCFPESHWKEVSLDEQYSAIENSISHWQNVIQKYGDNFKVTHKIINQTVIYEGSKASFTTSENQKHISIYGVDMGDRTVYSIELKVTLKGSANEDTSGCSITCVKIGSKWYANDYLTS